VRAKDVTNHCSLRRGARARKLSAIGEKRKREGGPLDPRPRASKRRKSSASDSDDDAMRAEAGGRGRPQGRKHRATAFAGVGGRLYARQPSVYLRVGADASLAYAGGGHHALDHGTARGSVPVTSGGYDCDTLAYFEVAFEGGDQQQWCVRLMMGHSNPRGTSWRAPPFL
jgi:hypothetical protein